jgi:hypothetical protein
MPPIQNTIIKKSFSNAINKHIQKHTNDLYRESFYFNFWFLMKKFQQKKDKIECSKVTFSNKGKIKCLKDS